MPGLRLVVTGGRRYADAATLHQVLSSIHHTRGIALLIHGACPTGADRLAADWAQANGIPTLAYKADWKRWDHRAGPIRNAIMLRESRPEVVLEFPGGKGTADCVRRAQRAGLPVWQPEATP